MKKESYLARIKKLRLDAQEQRITTLPTAKAMLEKAETTESEFISKMASSVGDVAANVVVKAKRPLESEERPPMGDGIKESGAIARRPVGDARDQAQSLLNKSTDLVRNEDEGDDGSAIRLAIEKMRGRDRVGLAGEQLSGAGGAAAGVVMAGTVAGAAGATTLLGSTGLAGLLGGVFVTATPVGWVIGSAAIFGAAGYGIAKMIRSGSEQDRRRKDFIGRQTERLMTLETGSPTVDERAELGQLIALTVAASVIEEDAVRRMVNLLNTGKLAVPLALDRVRRIALTHGLIESKS